MTKKELLVAALENGTAIDHIPTNELFNVVKLLDLDHNNSPLTVGNNLESKKTGRKGIIKVADRYFSQDEIDRIALIAPKVHLNIIKNYEVVEKKRVTLPDKIIDIIKCNNPKCITNNEPMKTRFIFDNKELVTLKCDYCGLLIKKEEMRLK